VEREWIEALKARLPASWAAYEPDPHFAFLYDREVKETRIREMARTVIEHLRGAVAPRFPPAAPLGRVFLFRVCKDRDQFVQYGGPPDSSGYWSARDGECVLHEEIYARKDVLQTLRSIAVLQYLHLAGAPGTYPWFRVGLSTALSPRRVGRGWNPNSRWHHEARRRVKSGAFVPLRDLLRMDDDSFATRDLQGHTAQAWSVAWFLLGNRHPIWEGILERYYRAHRDRLASEPPSSPLSPPDRRAARDDAIAAAREAGFAAAFGDFDDTEWRRLELVWRESL
jgi:hypothetical protein